MDNVLTSEGLTALGTVAAAVAAAIAAYLSWRVAKTTQQNSYNLARAKVVAKLSWDRDSNSVFMVVTNYGGVASDLIFGKILGEGSSRFNQFEANSSVRNGIPYLGPQEEVKIKIADNISDMDLIIGTALASRNYQEHGRWRNYPYKLDLQYRDWLSGKHIAEQIELRLDDRFLRD